MYQAANNKLKSEEKSAIVEHCTVRLKGFKNQRFLKKIPMKRPGKGLHIEEFFQKT